MSTQTGRDSEKFVLRMPDGMRHRIKAAALSNNRSMNAEIIATLEMAYPPPRSPDEFIANVVGIGSLLELSNSTGLRRTEVLQRINARLIDAGASFRIVDNKNRITLVTIGSEWADDSPGEADDGRKEH